MAQNCKIVPHRKHREDIDPYQTFSANIERAEYFIELYKQKIKVRACKGRPPISDTDILRAGVVFLHSTVEEYLRTIIRRRKISLLKSNESWKDVLRDVSLPGKNSGKSTAAKIELNELFEYKDKNVMDLILEAVNEKVDYLTFNNYSQIVSSLDLVGIKLPDKGKEIDCESINSYIERRHKIVHEADKNEIAGKGNYRTQSINSNQLKKWIEAAKVLVDKINEIYAQL